MLKNHKAGPLWPLTTCRPKDNLVFVSNVGFSLLWEADNYRIISIKNTFTNTAYMSSHVADSWTDSYPSQHEVGLLGYFCLYVCQSEWKWGCVLKGLHLQGLQCCSVVSNVLFFCILGQRSGNLWRPRQVSHAFINRAFPKHLQYKYPSPLHPDHFWNWSAKTACSDATNMNTLKCTPYT